MCFGGAVLIKQIAILFIKSIVIIHPMNNWGNMYVPQGNCMVTNRKLSYKIYTPGQHLGIKLYTLLLGNKMCKIFNILHILSPNNSII